MGISVDEITIEDIVIKSGSKKGDGFACEIAAVQFTAIINGNPEENNYIAKYAPGGARGEMLKMVNNFDPFYPPASEVSREVANFIWRKTPHTQ